MTRKSRNIFFLYAILFFIFLQVSAQQDARFISFIADPKDEKLELYWKDDQGKILGSLQRVKEYVEGKGSVLVFAMNGGMYMRDNSPQGLFIQNGKVVTPVDTMSGNGNFYMKPNGVFYITAHSEGRVCQTTDFSDYQNIVYATQSGPMLVINGNIHPNFKKGSVNLNIRNGVGILPDGKILFAMSKKEINFYDFATYFKEMGCENALYLDGFVSRTYLPAQNWNQLDGNFGVIIGVTKK